jgi:hypothetical protein
MSSDQIATKEDLIELEKSLKAHFAELIVSHRPKKFIKTGELKKILGLSDSGVQNLRISGILPFTRLNGTIYYDWDEIVAILEKGKSTNKRRW